MKFLRRRSPLKFHCSSLSKIVPDLHHLHASPALYKGVWWREMAMSVCQPAVVMCRVVPNPLCQISFYSLFIVLLNCEEENNKHHKQTSTQYFTGSSFSNAHILEDTTNICVFLKWREVFLFPKDYGLKGGDIMPVLKLSVSSTNSSVRKCRLLLHWIVLNVRSLRGTVLQVRTEGIMNLMFQK